MPEFDEDLIWDTIMDSGKHRIDYPAFAAFFPFKADNFLSSVIYGFAMNRGIEAIAANIAAQVSQTGNAVDTAALQEFIARSRDALHVETRLTADALRRLARGEDPERIYQDVLEALSAS